MKRYSGVLLVTKNNSVLCQQRDDKAGIVNPGMITTFGGLNEEDESPLEGAVREINDETNLCLQPDELQPFIVFKKEEDDKSITEVHIYVTNNIETRGLEVYEGKGFYEVAFGSDLEKINLSDTAKRILGAFFGSLSK